MKTKIVLVLFMLLNVNSIYSTQRKQKLSVLIDHAVEIATEQSFSMCNVLKDSIGLLPRSINKDGKLITSDSRWWCSGFSPVYFGIFMNIPGIKTC